MEAEARYTRVGAIVLALLAALIVAVLWLSKVGGQGDFKRYAIHFEQQALDGLQVGADVSLRGIKIGRVEDYSLATSKFNRVRVELRVDGRAPVLTNTVAVVTRNFVTGIAAITLITPEPPGEPLLQVAEGETYPLIKEGRSDLDVITGRVQQVGEMAATTLTSVNHLLSSENREEVMATIRNLRQLSQGLNSRLGALDRTLAQTGAAAESVGQAATQLSGSGERITAVVERMGSRLDGTLTETERTLVEARQALTQAAKAVEALQTQSVATARRLEDTASGVDDQLSVAMSELRLSIDAATRVFDRLRDPRAALLGPSAQQLGPGEKKP